MTLVALKKLFLVEAKTLSSPKLILMGVGHRCATLWTSLSIPFINPVASAIQT
jgi:hypothetical protein